MASLFDPIQLGAIAAPNRILMAPMTRARASRDHVPTAVMTEYYVQRASAGLIISEAAGISRQGLGWPYAPGLWSREQVAAWRPIVRAVHDAGGRIMAQLWHMGRLVHPSFLDGAAPVSACETVVSAEAHTYDGKQPYGRARALAVSEIAAIVEDYRRAAGHAMEAGFDGVQLHAANGYLIDQFARDGANHRTDAYGGSIENRLRLLVETVEAIAHAVGADRTAVRLSPNDDPHGCADSNSEALFTAIARTLDGFGLAFLEMRASRPRSSFRDATRSLAPVMRRVFRGPFILNSDYQLADASAALAAGEADAIAFGRTFLANPDLPARLARGSALNVPVVATYYSQGAAGYLDYPAMTPEPAGRQRIEEQRP